MSQALIAPMATPVATDHAEPATTMPGKLATAEVAEPDTPPMTDTYSLVYAFGWALLVPGLLLLNTQPFRTYDFAYVTYATLPFLLGVLATFLTDSHDHGKTLWKRILILTPLSIVCGVGVLWTLALTAVPISPYLEPQNYSFTTPLVVALLFIIAGPLLYSVWKRLTRRPTWQSILQLAVLIFAIGTVIWLGYMMFQPHNAVRSFARKDIMIYVTGALMWYLPSFGISTAIWRKLGVV